MCRLITVGSGSSGNTYLLQCGDEVLVLDCGMRLMDTKKALNFYIRGIVGAVVTHSHGDHAKYIPEYEAAGIPVWKPYEMESLRKDTQMGGFRLQSFGVVHSVPTVGHLIGHERLGKMLYVTDTEYVKYRFKGLNTILIEMNYSNEYIDREASKFHHVLTGHMEKQTTLEFIKANMSLDLRHIVLCHLSADGSDPVEFKEDVREIVPSWVTVDVAVPNLVVDLGEIPF